LVGARRWERVSAGSLAKALLLGAKRVKGTRFGEPGIVPHSIFDGSGQSGEFGIGVQDVVHGGDQAQVGEGFVGGETTMLLCSNMSAVKKTNVTDTNPGDDMECIVVMILAANVEENSKKHHDG